MGVLRALARNRIPIQAIVGVSAGAVIAAYYAAVGLGLEELVADAERFRGRHLLAYGLNVHMGHRLEHGFVSAYGIIPARLQQLDAARFDRLYHRIEQLGIVCHDRVSRSPRYFCTGADHGVRLSEAVRASAAIPALFPALEVRCDGEALRLTDGGVSDPIPIAFAKGPAIGATHVIVSDCRWIGRCPAPQSNTVWIRPRMRAIGTLWSPVSSLVSAVRDGELAVTDSIINEITGWLPDRDGRGP